MPALPTQLCFDWRHAVLALATIACVMSAPVDRASAEARTLRPIFWQQRLFFIPYQVNQRDQSLRHVAKVQLLTSRDGMSDWRVLEQAEPNVQGFSYHAPEDGEYWFALRHLNKRGQPWPHATVRPQMRIVVDTELPKLELSGALNATGAVVVSYEARDMSLRPETLVLEVRANGGPWTAIQAGPPDVSHADRIVGRVEWHAPLGASKVEIRGSIADGAGQRTQATAAVALSGPALRTPKPTAAGAPSVDPFQISASPPTQTWPSDNRLPQKPATANKPNSLFAGPSPPAEPPINNPYSTPGAAGFSNRTPAQLIGENSNGLAPSRQPVTVGSSASQDGWSAPAAAASENGARVVNSRTFDVEYALESIGPWGIAKVELWGTHDGGRSWQSFGVDNDNRSPVRATVPTAGLYGFRILVDGANGAATPRPRNGDKPELVVAVDLDPPSAELLSAEVGQRNLTGHLVVRWNVTDTNLEPRPISLYYGTLPNGPWTTIATGLENTGGYTWRMERHVPDRFYLRLEARDVAGNSTTKQTAAPILLNRPQPTGRLRGVRPVEANVRGYDTAKNGR